MADPGNAQSETQQLDGQTNSLNQPANDDSTTNGNEDTSPCDKGEPSTETAQQGQAGYEGVALEKQISSAVDSQDQNVEPAKSEQENANQSQGYTANTSVRFTNEIFLTL